MQDVFMKLAKKASSAVGSPWAFIAAASAVLLWVLCGPIFKFSDTWQLVINTSTTIITFLMVFLIQNTQNQDSKAIHLKLDELIRSIEGARNELIDLEDVSSEELVKLESEFKKLHEDGGAGADDVLSAIDEVKRLRG